VNIVALCDKDTAFGLRLAGIHDVRILKEDMSDAINLWNTIEENNKDVGLVLITEEIIERIGRQINEFRLKHILPIVVEIPDKRGRKKTHIDYVSYLINKAVGMEIKKER
jgi:V/A-type H+-transporting ATPase subunit F